jgi:uncharacterized protein YlaN (UPF0358 family)
MCVWPKHFAEMHDFDNNGRLLCLPLQLENLLLSDGPMNERVAKLADFGLHKRARLNATGQLTAPAAFGKDHEK